MMTWRPDTDPGMIFYLEMGDDIDAIPTCVRATVDGVDVADPQKSYEYALIFNNVRNQATDKFSGAQITRRVAGDGVLEVTVGGLNNGQTNAVIAWMENRYSIPLRFIAGGNTTTLKTKARK